MDYVIICSNTMSLAVPMMNYCQFRHFRPRKYIRKCCLQNDRRLHPSFMGKIFGVSQSHGILFISRGFGPWSSIWINTCPCLDISILVFVIIVLYAEIILGTGSANESRRCYATPSLIGWAHTQHDPSYVTSCYNASCYNGNRGYVAPLWCDLSPCSCVTEPRGFIPQSPQAMHTRGFR